MYACMYVRVHPCMHVASATSSAGCRCIYACMFVWGCNAMHVECVYDKYVYIYYALGGLVSTVAP